VQAAPDAAGRALLKHRHPGADEADPRDPRLLKQQGIGAIFVSHSKEEAFAFADRLALFRAGRIEQVGQPEQLYRRPQNRFVAEFLGGVNYLAAEVVDSHRVRTALGVICGQEPHGRAVGERLQLMLRPSSWR
jgi:iron(III) transport system ATP-binding protein